MSSPRPGQMQGELCVGWQHIQPGYNLTFLFPILAEIFPLFKHTMQLIILCRQHISRAVLEAVCFQVSPRFTKNKMGLFYKFIHKEQKRLLIVQLLFFTTFPSKLCPKCISMTPIPGEKFWNTSQVAEIFRAMVADSGCEPKQFLVDGG